MDNLPYSIPVAIGIVLALLAAFAVVVIYAYNDWIRRHDGPPSVADQVRLDDTLPLPAVDDTLEVPIVAPGTPVPAKAAAMPRPPVTIPAPAPALPVRLPSPVAREFVSNPASHEKALTEALFLAAQASCEPHETVLVPLRPVAADTFFAPPVEEHIQQMLVAAHSYRDERAYEPQHRASMA